MKYLPSKRGIWFLLGPLMGWDQSGRGIQFNVEYRMLWRCRLLWGINDCEKVLFILIVLNNCSNNDYIATFLIIHRFHVFCHKKSKSMISSNIPLPLVSCRLFRSDVKLPSSKNHYFSNIIKGIAI